MRHFEAIRSHVGGVHKLRHGVDWMTPLLEAKGLPALMAYGAYVGEVVAPLFILAGVLTRLASLVVAGTMVTGPAAGGCAGPSARSTSAPGTAWSTGS